MAESMGIYSIDGADVNAREDVRHTLPHHELTANRREGFPGSPLRFTVVGQLLGPTFSVFAWLEAATIAGLHALVSAAQSLKTDAALHTVVIHDTSYPDCQCVDVVVVIPTTVFVTEAGQNWVRCRIRYDWAKLTDGGAS